MRSRASTSSASAFRRERSSVVHYGLDELPAAWGPPGGPTLAARAPACSSPSPGSSSRRASTSRSRRLRRVRAATSGRRSRRSRRSARRGARCEALAAARGIADAVHLAGQRRGRRRLARAAPSCSSTRPAGKASGSRCSRRCLPGCRSSQARSARSPRSSSTARPGSSFLPTTCRSCGGAQRPARRPGAARAPTARPASSARARVVLGRARWPSETLAVYADALG